MHTRKIVLIIHVLYTDVFYEMGSYYQSASTILLYKAYTSHIYLRYIDCTWKDDSWHSE